MGAVTFGGHTSFQPVINAIIELAEHAAKEPWPLPEPSVEVEALKSKLDALVRLGIADAYKIVDKGERHHAVDAVKAAAMEAIKAEGLDTERAKAAFKDLEADVVRGAILATGLRIDGRDTKTVRPIVAEVGLLPRAHGSSPRSPWGVKPRRCASRLWAPARTSRSSTLSRASTAPTSCCTTTSRPTRSVKRAAWVHQAGVKSAMANRRGARSVRCCRRRTNSRTRCGWSPRLPGVERFVLDGDRLRGSSRALMDAGVPLKRPVAGIAMGLIKEDHGFAVLSDILGDEDHLGDMDFKVAGTEAAACTSLQMDIKITSITPEIMRIALAQARGTGGCTFWAKWPRR